MAESFASTVADLDYPMAVVTCSDGDQLSGCLVGFTSQCSIRPPRVTTWISRSNHTHPVAMRAGHLGVHWLSSSDCGLAELFGEATGDAVDKFSRCRWRPGVGGTPVLQDCGRWFVGRVLDRRGDGDHTGFLLEPVECGAEPGWPGQLGYQSVRHLDPGHQP